MTISLHWIVYTESVFIGSIWFDAYGVIRTWTGVIFNTYLIIEENAPKRGKMTCSGGKDRLISFYNLIANACVYWIISLWIDLGLFFFFLPYIILFLSIEMLPLFIFPNFTLLLKIFNKVIFKIFSNQNDVDSN